jgi:hypothetical protein
VHGRVAVGHKHRARRLYTNIAHHALGQFVGRLVKWVTHVGETVALNTSLLRPAWEMLSIAALRARTLALLLMKLVTSKAARPSWLGQMATVSRNFSRLASRVLQATIP